MCSVPVPVRGLPPLAAFGEVVEAEDRSPKAGPGSIPESITATPTRLPSGLAWQPQRCAQRVGRRSRLLGGDDRVERD